MMEHPQGNTGRQASPNDYFENDLAFDRLYPPAMQLLAKVHFTPLDVAQEAAAFLAAENNRVILDVGSGVGKFCLAAAFYQPHCTFVGVEHRANLAAFAEAARRQLALQNVRFQNKDFTELDFTGFDHFYIYNPFYENLDEIRKIDSAVQHSSSLFNYYNRQLFKNLNSKPVGTRVATFHSLENEMPPSYYEVNTRFGNLLKFWMKV